MSFICGNTQPLWHGDDSYFGSKTGSHIINNNWQWLIIKNNKLGRRSLPDLPGRRIKQLNDWVTAVVTELQHRSSVAHFLADGYHGSNWDGWNSGRDCDSRSGHHFCRRLPRPKHHCARFVRPMSQDERKGLWREWNNEWGSISAERDHRHKNSKLYRPKHCIFIMEGPQEHASQHTGENQSLHPVAGQLLSPASPQPNTPHNTHTANRRFPEYRGGTYHHNEAHVSILHTGPNGQMDGKTKGEQKGKLALSTHGLQTNHTFYSLSTTFTLLILISSDRDLRLFFTFLCSNDFDDTWMCM